MDWLKDRHYKTIKKRLDDVDVTVDDLSAEISALHHKVLRILAKSAVDVREARKAEKSPEAKLLEEIWGGQVVHIEEAKEK